MLALLLSALLALGGSPVTDDILDRLARLEQQATALGAQQRALAAEVIRRRGPSDAMSERDVAALLSPRGLTPPIGTRGALDRTPDLATPLLSRLRDDAALSAYASGRVDTFAGYANLLDDPTFDTLAKSPLGSFTTIGTSYTAIGTGWEAKYVLNSGTVATTRQMGLIASRAQADYAYGSSAVGEIDLLFGVNASDMTIYLRQTQAYQALGTIPSWLVAAMRVWLFDYGGGSTPNVPVTAYMEIVDAADAVLASGDPEDLMTLLDLAEQSRIETGYEGPAVATDYRLRLRVDVVKTAGSTGQTYIQVAEPLLAFSDDGSAPAYTPSVGSWLPGSPGRQLVTREFLASNVAAGATVALDVSAGGFASQVPEVWGGSIVGLAYRWTANITGGTHSLRALVNGSVSWTAFSSASAREDSISQPPFVDTFVAGDDITVEVVTGGGFLPAGTNDIVVVLYLLLDYDGT